MINSIDIKVFLELGSVFSLQMMCSGNRTVKVLWLFFGNMIVELSVARDEASNVTRDVISPMRILLDTELHHLPFTSSSANQNVALVTAH